MNEALSRKLNVVTITFFIFLFHGINPIEKLLNPATESPGHVQKNNLRFRGDKGSHVQKVQPLWMASGDSPFHEYMKERAKLYQKPLSKRREPAESKSGAYILDTQIESPPRADDAAVVVSKERKDNSAANFLRSYKERQSSKFISHPKSTEKSKKIGRKKLSDLVRVESKDSEAEKLSRKDENKVKTEFPTLDGVKVPKTEAPSPPSQTLAASSTPMLDTNASDATGGGAKTMNATKAEAPTEDQMPSFDEWKKQRLEEHEKTGQSIPAPNGNQKAKPKPKSKVKKNYASADCGAKILATNAEAHHSSHILNAFKDEYMLNPCNARIWFVVELCESIQPHTLEMANFELFSSMPKEFNVYLSERYPSREWTVLGNFHSKDERVLQEFPLQERIFGKYIKVELSSHYGSEHYCPLSLFQVYGTSMVEEIEGIETPESTHDDDEDSLLDNNDPAKNNNQNLFGSAKDAVLQIVKTAAKAFTGEEEKQYIINGSKNHDGSSEVMKPSSIRSDINISFEELSISNISRILYELNKTLGLVDYKGVPNMLSFNFLSQLSKILSTCSTCRTCSNCRTHSRSLAVTTTESSRACRYLKALIGPVKFNIFCQVFKIMCNEIDSNQLSLKESHGYSSVMFNIFRSYFCSSILDKQSSVCKADDVLNKRIVIPSADKVGNIMIDDASQNSSSFSSAAVETQIEGTFSLAGSPVVSQGSQSTVVSERSKTDQTERKVLSDKSEASSATLAPSTPTLGDHTARTETNGAGSVKNIITSESIPEQGSSSGSFILPSTVDKTVTESTSKTETVIPEIVPSSNGKPMEKTHSETQSKSVETAPAASQVLEKENPDAKNNVSTPVSRTVVETASPENLTVEEPKDLAGQDSPETTAHQPSSSQTQQTSGQVMNGNSGVLPGGQKESVFMRLSNKIKLLELNLSLSSQYLEELSKRYRKQMDQMTEMQRIFNLSIASLNQTAQSSVEKNNHLEKKILHLEVSLGNLTESYVALVIEKENLASTLVEWHLILIVVELIAMVAIFIACVRLSIHQISTNCQLAARSQEKVNSDGVKEKHLENLSNNVKECKTVCDAAENINKKRKNRMKKHNRSQSNDLKDSFFVEELNGQALRPLRVSTDSSLGQYRNLSANSRRNSATSLASSKHSPAGLLFNSRSENRIYLNGNHKFDAVVNKENFVRRQTESPDLNRNNHNKFLPLSNLNCVEDLVNKNNQHSYKHRKKSSK